MNIIKDYFMKITELPDGEELFIPQPSMKDARKLSTLLNREKDGYMRFNPEHASRILITHVLKLQRAWVRATVTKLDPTKVYRKQSDGVTVEDNIRVADDRDRLIQCMIRDDLSKGEINFLIEGGLTDEETKKYFGK